MSTIGVTTDKGARDHGDQTEASFIDMDQNEMERKNLVPVKFVTASKPILRMG